MVTQSTEFSITSRSRARTEAPTRAWHDVHTRGLIKEIYFTNQWDASEEETFESKGEAVRRIGARALIDDSLHHAESCAKIGVPAYLVPRPWNIGKPVPSGVHKPMVWSEIARAILSEQVDGKL